MKTAGQIVYETFALAMDERFLPPGDHSPTWDQIHPMIKECWELAADDIQWKSEIATTKRFK
jgi:hypothetical protein